jgi:uncharacterized membrane protein
MAEVQPAPAPDGGRPRGADDQSTMALVVYVLYLVGYVVGVTTLVGVILAYVYRREAPPWLQSHFEWQVRTFWILLAYVVVGSILTLVWIGFLLLFWAFVWSLVRNIKGLVTLTHGQPVSAPRSWLFG